MPIASSSVLQQIRDTNYTKTRVPYFPKDKWVYGYTANSYQPTDGTSINCYGYWVASASSNGLAFQDTGSDSYGEYGDMITGATSGNYAAQNVPAYQFSYQLKQDVRMLLHFKLLQTTNFRFFFGFASVTSNTIRNVADDDILGYVGNYSGFGLRVGLNGNFKITHNDGSENGVLTSDIDTIDTDVHQLYLEADSINSRWGYSLDDSPITYISSQIPAATTTMYFMPIIQTFENAAKTLRLYQMQTARKEIF